MRLSLILAGIISLFLASCNVRSASEAGEGMAIEYAKTKGLTNVVAHPILVNDSTRVCPITNYGVLVSSDQGPAVVCFTEEGRPFIPQTFTEPSNDDQDSGRQRPSPN